MLKFLVTGLTAFSLAAAPVGAAAAPGRASAPTTDANALAGESGGLIVALVILAGTIFAIMSQEDDDDPDSP
jgi:hypothetical protein